MEYISDQSKFLPPPPHPIFYNIDEYEQLKLAASKLAEREKNFKEHVFAQRCYFCAKRVSKIVVLSKKMLLSFSVVRFLTSQIESIRWT